jgi:hypothetical protein
MKPPRWQLLLVTLFFALLSSGCLAPRVSQSQANVPVSILADGAEETIQINSGAKVADALAAAGIEPGALDKVEPPLYTLVPAGLQVRVVRGREEFETGQSLIPFERQTVQNESMPLGETLLLQAGQNGEREVVYRRYYEDGLLLNTSISRSTVLRPAVDEIIMVGVQKPFAPLPIAGKLIYLAGGNAWLMQGSTSNRAPLLTSADLDGRILRLSRDGRWLLYTRKPQNEGELNSLWVLDISNPQAAPIDLKTPNIIHFADFDPKAALTILYSTVEPRPAAPGWQANNDLYRMKFGANGNLGVREKIVDANTGGVYGWWGTTYLWSPAGNYLAYSRPDGVGLVSFKNKNLVPLLQITPLQTRADWAFIPPLGWGADGQTLFAVTHAPPPGLVNPEESPNFDLSALSLENQAQARLVQQSGMFAYPSASPAALQGDEMAYYLGYLQALNPTQSETSGYRLLLMDRDGSNRRVIFPPEGSPGLEPQTPVWSPSAPSFREGDFVAVLYNGNLWLLDAATGTAHQVTGDGLIQKVIWGG